MYLKIDWIICFRIPISSNLHLNNPCFKKRLFVYIFPVIFLSIILNIFKFLESSVTWEVDPWDDSTKINLNINQLRYDYLYLLLNGWIRYNNLRDAFQKKSPYGGTLSQLGGEGVKINFKMSLLKIPFH